MYVALSYGNMSWSAVCDCSISLSLSKLPFINVKGYILTVAGHFKNSK